MLLNLSNHPSYLWNDFQKMTAQQLFGQIVDIPFPDVSPKDGTEAIDRLANNYLQLCLDKIITTTDPQDAVHLMGEMTFSFKLVALLQRKGIKCIASTATRDATDHGNGEKSTRFEFVAFREYPALCK